MKQIRDDIVFLDSDSQKSLTNFLRNFENNELTIVCGAGLSVSAGLPTWTKFLKTIVTEFLFAWRDIEENNKIYKEVAPKSISINMLAEYYEVAYPDFKIPDSFYNEDPLILAQLIKNCIELNNWRYLLRKALYENVNLNFSSELIANIYNLVSTQKRVTSILTYNYDDLIEIYFKNQNFKTSSVVGDNYFSIHKNFPIYHMHGILPYKGGLESKIYLTEDDYLTDIIQPNSWYNQLHTTKLTSTTCLFIGLSFNDPSLKRKLSIHRLSPNAYHYALITHQDTEYDKRKFLLLKNELLRLNVRVIKYPYSSTHDELNNIIKLINKYVCN
ncbi:SIR2 family protein [Emticicia sp. SJ17W-69]|uniref:SIR2 family protein n=1 Tax=Emticicia sp. SJ17W-69 TaxID=3421657 RepID=UPI003EC0612F